MTTGSSGVHSAAATGFEQNAADYELARPGYPHDALELLTEKLPLGPGRTVADVGAGTGKMTRLLEGSGASVIAIEPVRAMRAELVQALPSAITVGAAADQLPLRTASLDAIVCAQSFHWFATTTVLREFARVLRQGGGLTLLWNVRDNTEPWVRSFTELLRPYEGDRPDHNRGSWRQVFEEESFFAPLETASFRHSQPMTPDLLVARAASMSFVGALESQTRRVLLEQVRRLGTERGDSFELPYRTDLHLTVRR
ncbi:MAG: class I SAM-dependent methyltransferase [Acidimicrobiales bacterium]